MFNLQEAFSKLNMMESGDFALLDKDEKDAMKGFLEDDGVEAEEVDIIDPQADDDFDLQDSYVGKIIVQCPVCKSLIYKTQEELDEMGDEPQNCPYCFSVEKFDLVGKIVPIEDETAPEVADAEQPEAEEPVLEEPVLEEPALEEDCDNICPKCGKNPCVCEDKCNECGDAPLHEDLENITIETEDEIINVSAEDKVEEAPAPVLDEVPAEEPAEEEHAEAEVIAPLDDEAAEDEEEIFDNEEEEIDEVDEDSFDEFAESFLRDNYSNVKSYKTNRIKDCGTYMIAEGFVTLADNKKKLTEFKIKPSKFSRNGKGSCLVENLQLGKKTTISASVRK